MWQTQIFWEDTKNKAVFTKNCEFIKYREYLSLVSPESFDFAFGV